MRRILSLEQAVALAFCALLGYALGCLPFAVIVSRCMGLQDPRQYGSGNPGATNVLRTGNKKAALLTLLGDALKGVAAIVLVRVFANQLGLQPEQLLLAAVVAGAAAFVGHVFPATLGFRGGKGVATAAGVLLALDWRLGAVSLAVWLSVAFVTRYSSLAGMVAAMVSPVVAWFLFEDRLVPVVLLVMALVLVWRHSENIRRLRAGTEGRIGGKKAG